MPAIIGLERDVPDVSPYRPSPVSSEFSMPAGCATKTSSPGAKISKLKPVAVVNPESPGEMLLKPDGISYLSIEPTVITSSIPAGLTF